MLLNKYTIKQRNKSNKNDASKMIAHHNFIFHTERKK